MGKWPNFSLIDVSMLSWTTNGADRTGRMAYPMIVALVGGGWLVKAPPRRQPTSNPASVRREICVKREGAAC